MWNGCIDHDPSGQILSAWIAKEELRTLCATAAHGGHPSRSVTACMRSTAGAPTRTFRS